MSLPQGTKLSASFLTQDSDGYSTDPHVWEETPPVPKEGETKKSKRPADLNDYFGIAESGPHDPRETTLQLDLATVRVCEVQAVHYQRNEHAVARHRHEAMQYNFEAPHIGDLADKL